MNNKKYFERLPFGSEPEKYESEFCPECRALPCELHLPGCMVERCPKCKASAIYCGCGGLSFKDKVLLKDGAIARANRAVESINTVMDEEDID